MKNLIRKLAVLGAIGGVATAVLRLVQQKFRPRPADDPMAPSGPALVTPRAEVAPSPTPTAETPPVMTLVADVPGAARWVEPEPDGSCRVSHPIKANADSGIYHPPSGAFYGRTKAERCYADPAEAEADGFRAARR